MCPFDKSEKNWITMPKVGEKYDFTIHGKITEIKKVEGGKFNFTKREKIVLPDGKEAFADQDLGYHYDICFEDGKKMSINSWSPYYAMDKAGIVEGVSMIVEHLAKGEWKITKVE